jgi:hypothetical protein
VKKSYRCTPDDIGRLIRDLESEKKRLKDKMDEIVRRLADLGVQVAQIGFLQAKYDGNNDAEVTTKRTGPARYEVIANGKAVLFIEFGAGIRYNYDAAHPMASDLGMGPGTYPDGKGHWDDPKGWYVPGSGIHTYGNPPEMPMYIAQKDITESVTRIAKEVLLNG